MGERVHKTEHLGPWQKAVLYAPFVDGQRHPIVRFSGQLPTDREPSCRQSRQGELIRFDVENTSDHPVTAEVIVFEE
jgi:hypothetical protein